MKRIAILVDAGYLYAQGSASLNGSKVKRESLQLAYEEFIELLLSLASAVQPDASLLRIYWYDGTSRGPTQDHRSLADLDNVKLRLGFINSVGQQKGVDSLLVTDLVELSRNGAICDALVLGGDEDLRIGVQIAQSFGVRVHLLGIAPSRGSQSLQLRQEADTKHEISVDQVKTFLSIAVRAVLTPVIMVHPVAEKEVSAGGALAPTAKTSALEQGLNEGIHSVLQKLSPAEMKDISNTVEKTHSVPWLHDRRVLASCRTSLGRDLSMEEKKVMRVLFTSALQTSLEDA